MNMPVLNKDASPPKIGLSCNIQASNIELQGFLKVHSKEDKPFLYGYYDTLIIIPNGTGW